jgi:hypothetical protein
MEETRVVVMLFSVAWTAWAGLALWVMRKPPTSRIDRARATVLL